MHSSFRQLHLFEMFYCEHILTTTSVDNTYFI